MPVWKLEAEEQSLSNVYSCVAQLFLTSFELGIALRFLPQSKKEVRAVGANRARASKPKKEKNFAELVPIVQEVCASLRASAPARTDGGAGEIQPAVREEQRGDP